MELKGQKVIHIMPGGKPGKYGTGTIVDTQNKDVLERIDVKFNTEEKVKSFSFPECFGRYLMLENFELAKQIEDIQKVYSAAREKLPHQEKTSSKAQKPVETANSILDELDSMIGLDEVKRDVHMLTAFIRVNNLRRARGLKAPVISKHLVLTGNPGTGKTTRHPCAELRLRRSHLQGTRRHVHEHAAPQKRRSRTGSLGYAVPRHPC